MTVAELIEELQAEPDKDRLVVLQSGQEGDPVKPLRSLWQVWFVPDDFGGGWPFLEDEKFRDWPGSLKAISLSPVK